ncbi:MAG: DDE-type integrase/transposase/recombinase, partial [Anaerolineales bacterium]|nr:DDE-type integrase/transposase/recombinase [Anaerolineales bacterium]
GNGFASQKSGAQTPHHRQFALISALSEPDAGSPGERPDEAWVADITYIRLKHGFVYLAVLMNVCTRAIRSWHLGRTLEQTLTLEALLKALATQHCPQIHHSDQGAQYHQRRTRIFTKMRKKFVFLRVLRG